MSRYALLAPNAFGQIPVNAGILATGFDKTTGVVSGILGVTSGGLSFIHTPTYKDYGEDMDNCPRNVYQLKRKESDEVKISGTFVTISTGLAKLLIGAADVIASKVTPRFDPVASDYTDLWLICDYSDDISESTGGYVAIHMMKGLSTGGFQLQTTDKDKGKFSFEFTAHHDYNNPSTVPYEVYIKAGTGLGYMTVSSAAGTSTGKTKLTVTGYVPSTGESYKYKTAASVTMPSRGDSLSAWTAWNGVDEITATTGNEIAVCVADSNGTAVAGAKTTVVSA